MARAFLDVVEALRYTKTFTELQYSACNMREACSFNSLQTQLSDFQTQHTGVEHLGWKREVTMKESDRLVLHTIRKGDGMTFNFSLYPSTSLLGKIISHKFS